MGSKKDSHSSIARVSMAMFGIVLILLSAVILCRFLPWAGNDKPNSVSAEKRFVIPVRVNYPAPALTLENVDGKVESINDYLGKVVLVNNWATWCPPCKAEMPILADYYTDHVDEGLSVVAIEAGDPREKVLQFADGYDLQFTIWLDPDFKALDAFNNQNLPSSYVMDRNGIVRYAWTGEINRELLEEFITPLLSED